MQNYIEAVRYFLENDIDIQAFTSNIHFLRVPKEKLQRPLIVFSEDDQNNPYSEGNMQTKGWDVFPVHFECIVDYSKDVNNNVVKGRELRELLKAKFNGFKGVLNAGVLGKERNGQIYHEKDFAVEYDNTNDVVRWISLFKFKSFK